MQLKRNSAVEWISFEYHSVRIANAVHHLYLRFQKRERIGLVPTDSCNRRIATATAAATVSDGAAVWAGAALLARR